MAMFDSKDWEKYKGRKCVQTGRCCRNNPGWFGPGEAEKAAESLGMSMEQFVREFLVIDSLELEAGKKVEVFAPAKLEEDGSWVSPPNTKADAAYKFKPGRCIFFDGPGCRIYQARPIECRHYSCIHRPEQNLSRREIAQMWYNAWVEAHGETSAAEEEPAASSRQLGPSWPEGGETRTTAGRESFFDEL